jgi:hypothetical protein
VISASLALVDALKTVTLSLSWFATQRRPPLPDAASRTTLDDEDERPVTGAVVMAWTNVRVVVTPSGPRTTSVTV